MPTPPAGWKFKGGPSAKVSEKPRTRELPVMAGARPAGMRPATEEEYQEFQDTNLQGAKQLFNLSAGMLGGLGLSGAAGRAPSLLRAVLASPAGSGALVGGGVSALEGDSLPQVALEAAGGAMLGRGAQAVPGIASAALGRMGGLGRLLRAALPAADEAASAAAPATQRIPAAASRLDGPQRVIFNELPLPAAQAAPGASNAGRLAQMVDEAASGAGRGAQDARALAAEAGTPLADDLLRSIEALKAKALNGRGAVLPPAPSAPASAPAATMAATPRPGIPVEEIESRVVKWATENKWSRKQILDSLKESGFNQERGMATQLLDMIAQKYGLKLR